MEEQQVGSLDLFNTARRPSDNGSTLVGPLGIGPPFNHLSVTRTYARPAHTFRSGTELRRRHPAFNDRPLFCIPTTAPGQEVEGQIGRACGAPLKAPEAGPSSPAGKNGMNMNKQWCERFIEKFIFIGMPKDYPSFIDKDAGALVRYSPDCLVKDPSSSLT